MVPLSKMAAGIGLSTLLILSPLDAALGAGVGNTTFAATDLSSSVLPRKGDSIEAQQRVPLFPKQMTTRSNIHKLNVSYYGQRGDRFKVRDMKGELLKIHSDDLGEVWTPLWYWTKDAGQVVQLGDMKWITLSSKAKLALTPNSSITWDNKVAGDSEWIAVAQWKSWVGVLANPEPWQQDGEIYQPVLLWIEKQDIASEVLLPPGIFAPSSKISTDMIRYMASWLLVPGTDSSYVKKLLGAPQFIETSGNLQMENGNPMQLGKTWRYERPDGQFLVTFSQEGKLERTSWIIPGADGSRSIYTGLDYRDSYHFMNTPMSETLQMDPLWRRQGDLDFAYLLAATPDVLLIKGDDGGFSGMHQSSNIYAVTRTDGKKLWQVEAGFGILQVEAADSGDMVTILTDYNPEAKQYENRLRQIRLSDGKVLWERKSEDQGYRVGMGLAQNSVIMLETPDMEEKDHLAQLSVFDNTTGKLKWKREVPAKAQIFNAGGQNPYVLVRDQKALNAYDPNSGQVKWTVELQGQRSDYASYDAYYPGGPRINPLEPPSSSRWIQLGDRWMLLDLRTGNSLTEYSLTANERIEMIDERYLLVQRMAKTANHTGVSRSEEQYESALYDAEREQELWTMKGRASKGTIAGDILYLLADGIPTAVRLGDGTSVWQMNHITAEAENMSYFAGGGYIVMSDYLLLPYGPNLLVIDRQSGDLLGRMQNMLMGYAELRELESRNGTINSSGDELYVGTANGAIVRFSIREIEQGLVKHFET
ncbi:PQQ-like beta-propeller repeat protein [Paenibacillus motobuensis]|uniref:outer membrane protein assembly factor BamB family protein n=1 Tax=Paenibacillus TaxID=44249 RepID=UPI00203B282B|nr:MULTISPECIES: PQQ-binding-like beta-propeller repeat protein [Paenibacillus]MCM3042576.1 PQQ-like beta-propeller repeat protein [Paenibacillus lutimineralis]MCM3649680.1 PQQ-like beta-propeller repeat protein [Paenibacillus motobuensis]